MSKQEQPSTKTVTAKTAPAKAPAKTFSKEAILNHFNASDGLIAQVLLKDDTRYSVADAENMVKKWKGSKIK